MLAVKDDDSKSKVVVEDRVQCVLNTPRASLERQIATRLKP